MYFKCVSRNFQWCFEEVLRAREVTCFQKVTRKIEGCFKGVLREF